MGKGLRLLSRVPTESRDYTVGHYAAYSRKPYTIYCLIRKWSSERNRMMFYAGYSVHETQCTKREAGNCASFVQINERNWLDAGDDSALGT